MAKGRGGAATGSSRGGSGRRRLRPQDIPGAEFMSPGELRRAMGAGRAPTSRRTGGSGGLSFRERSNRSFNRMEQRETFRRRVGR
jgi:hypothetical protein